MLIALGLDGQECPPPSPLGSDLHGLAAGDQFGRSVALNANGSHMIVGAPGGDANGQVRVFTFENGDWSQLGQTLEGTSAGSQFGQVVDISSDGEVIAVAAPREDFSTGRVHIYRLSAGLWIPKGAALNGATPGDEYGTSISLSGDGNRLVVGAPLNSGPGFIRGTVTAYEYNGVSWSTLGGSIFGEANYDFWGVSVAMSEDGSTLAAASTQNDGGGENAGHVRVFFYNGSNWVQRGLEINGTNPNDETGGSLSLNADGTVVAIGAPNRDTPFLENSGQVRVFAYITALWAQLGNELNGEVAGEFFGSSVALNGAGEVLAVGAPFAPDSGTGNGLVRAYALLANEWVQSGPDITGGTLDDQFGVSVSYSENGNVFAIGIAASDTPETNAGSVRSMDASCQPGCSDSSACNYDPSADVDDGSCDYFSCITLGCTDETACNYAPEAEFEDGSCTYPDPGYNCDGTCLDSDGDSVCDFDEVAGCEDPAACNYNAAATNPGTACVYPVELCDVCTGETDGTGTVINLDDDGNGICIDVPGCTDTVACNYNEAATEDDGNCLYAAANCEVCSGATDGTGTVQLQDTDGDGVCDGDEILGCTDATASNFDPQATDNDGSCLEPLPANWNYVPTPSSALLLGQVTLDGLPASDGDWIGAFASTGTCVGLAELILFEDVAYASLSIYGDDATTTLVEGMQAGETFSLHYFDAALGMEWVWSNGFGQTQLTGWTNTNGAPLPGYADPQFIYEFLTDPSLAQCNDPAACNFTPESTTDINCTYPADGFDCLGNCLVDLDNDGVCDTVEIFGCTDETACNYDPFATEEDGSCNTFDACGVCGGLGAIYECGCFDIPDGDCDCNGNQPDALGVCGGNCQEDADGDGICDDVDPCVGMVDICGICNGPGPIYDCGCNPIPDGDCDCNGNQPDAIGVCGGDCPGDADGDGICDTEDTCVGQLDACGVCNGPGAIYECGCFEIGEVYCDCDGNQIDALGICGGDCPADIDGDGICDTEDTCIGFVDACGVCNGPGAIYDCGCDPLPPGWCDCDGSIPDAAGACGGDCTSDVDADGVCDDQEVLGCDDPFACNWQPGATDNDGSCLYPMAYLDCQGNCLIDTDGDGICEQDEISGCQDAAACNYDALATDSGYCVYPDPNYDCSGTCLNDIDGDGVCDELELLGCTVVDAVNFNPYATEPDFASCIFQAPVCLGDVNLDGEITTEDLLAVLGAFGGECPNP